MADPQAALLTQLRNIEAKTGRRITDLQAAAGTCGLAKFGERRSWLMSQFKLGHGDANTVLQMVGKQFAMIGPATRDLVEVGLNCKDLPAHPRLKLQPAGSMCQATTRIASAAEVDAQLIAWLRSAYDAAA